MSRSLDGLGSVVALSDANGVTVQTYDYTVYGRPSAADVNHPNPYLFTGRRYDRKTGLYYDRARMYDPYTGRLLQTDPIGYRDGVNGYRYCGNNPTNAVDASGEMCFHDYVSKRAIPWNEISMVAFDTDGTASGM